MAQQTVNSNATEPLGLPNTGSGVEMGDGWNASVTKLNAMFTEIYSGTMTIAGAKTTTGTWLFTAGAATTYGPGGNINKSITTIGSSATNTTQTLVSYTLPAAVLASTGNGIFVTAWGRKAANAAPVTMQLNIGGTSINTGAVTQNGVSWLLTGTAYKSGSNAQQEIYNYQFGVNVSSVKSTSDTSVDTGTIAITVQGLDASAAQSNILLDGLVVEFFP